MIRKKPDPWGSGTPRQYEVALLVPDHQAWDGKGREAEKVRFSGALGRAYLASRRDLLQVELIDAFKRILMI